MNLGSEINYHFYTIVAFYFSNIILSASTVFKKSEDKCTFKTNTVSALFFFKRATALNCYKTPINTLLFLSYNCQPLLQHNVTVYEEVFSTFYIYTCVYCCINCCKFLLKERWAGRFGLNQANTSDCGNGMSNSRLMFQRQWQLSGFSILWFSFDTAVQSLTHSASIHFVPVLCCHPLSKHSHRGFWEFSWPII